MYSNFISKLFLPLSRTKCHRNEDNRAKKDINLETDLDLHMIILLKLYYTNEKTFFSEKKGMNLQPISCTEPEIKIEATSIALLSCV